MYNTLVGNEAEERSRVQADRMRDVIRRIGEQATIVAGMAAELPGVAEAYALDAQKIAGNGAPAGQDILVKEAPTQPRIAAPKY